MPRLSELLAQRAELEKQIAETQRVERETALTQIRQLMNEYGLTAADLGLRAGAGAPRKPSASRPADGAPASRTGGKVAAKYRDAQTGESWSGRGLQPRWLKAALASGRKLSDFAV